MAVDIEVEVLLRHGQRNVVASLDACGEIVDEGSGERTDCDIFGAMDPLTVELTEENARVAVGVDGDAPGELARAMQTIRVRQTDFDPRRDPPRQIANDDCRF